MDDVDRVISAQIPNRETNPELYAVITKNMIHGPCRENNPTCVCMENNECKKQFPKAYTPETTRNTAGFIIYKRPEDGPSFTNDRGIVVDCKWVVPYNPYLTQKYKAHINVEISGKKSVKYVFKYIYKGYDCAVVKKTFSYQTEDDTGELVWDEIATFLDCRYVCADEAYWRILCYTLQRKSHSVERLQVHVEDEQPVYFKEHQEDAALARAEFQNSKLMAYFLLNSQDAYAHQFYYHQIPEHYCWIKGSKSWKRRARACKTIGRVYFVTPNYPERFYARLLLHHVRCAISFEDLRTVRGILCTTFEEACRMMGLVKEEKIWHDCMEEALGFKMPHSLRQMFAFIIVFGDGVHCGNLWNEFKEGLSEDFLRTHQEEDAHNRALWDIEQVLILHNRTCISAGLPAPHRPFDDEPPKYDRIEELIKGDEMLLRMNTEHWMQ